tara:strand:+ start:1474 stop:1671 length:198 start_codon:yes stop_codon:yes gene_type:complete
LDVVFYQLKQTLGKINVVYINSYWNGFHEISLGFNYMNLLGRKEFENLDLDGKSTLWLKLQSTKE